jgi:uncharacterized protein YbaP (TraB family)
MFNVLKRLFAAIWFAAVCLPASAVAQQPIPDPDEIVVDAPGPALWRMSDADSDVLILGSVAMLPRNVRWNARPFEAALARADRLYIERPMGVGGFRAIRVLASQRDVFENPNGARLRDFLPAPLYARTQAAAARLDVPMDSLERLRPHTVGSGLIRATVPAQGLAFVDMNDQTSGLARRARVRVTELETVQMPALLRAMNDMPLGADIACLDSQLDTIERQGPLLRDRSTAWARGDTAALRQFAALVDPTRCFESIATGGVNFRAVMRGRVTIWRDTLLQSMRRQGVRVAVIDTGLLLEPGGVLDALRESGANITNE